MPEPSTVLEILFVPVAALLIGGLLGVWWSPGRGLLSVTQHFTAGIVFAAVAIELLPALMNAPTVPLVIGFTAGVLGMLAIAQVAERADESEPPADESAPVASPATDTARKGTGLTVAVAVDVAMDGLLVGIAFVAGVRQGTLIAIALGFELFFLALTTSVTLVANRRRGLALFATIAMAMLMPAAAILGDTLLDQSAAAVRDGVIAFGTAALLYLVTEELLVEAHDVPDTPFSTATFFIGFLLVLLLERSL